MQAGSMTYTGNELQFANNTELPRHGKNNLYVLPQKAPKTSSTIDIEKKETTNKNNDLSNREEARIKAENREYTRKYFSHREDEFASKRQELLKKKHIKGLSGKEEKQLKYIQWQLDKIDDALYGSHIDELQDKILEKRQLTARVKEFCLAVRALEKRK